MKKSPDTLNFDGNTAEGTEEEGAGSVPDAPPPKVSPNNNTAEETEEEGAGPVPDSPPPEVYPHKARCNLT